MGNDPEPLQFDRAEPAQPAAAGTGGGPACEFCQAPLTESYFTAGGRKTCGTCRTGLEQALAAGKGAGSVLVALLLGGLAALVGGGLWYGIRELTGYDIGLIAIAVGYGVGMAVRKGSGGWGGRRFQLLAVGLTYLGIVFSMVPPLVGAVLKNPPPAAVESAPGEAAPPAARDPDAPGLLYSLAVLSGLLLAVPVMVGSNSPMMILIMGFGLWEAWKLNRRTELELAGPFRVGAPGATGGP